MKILGANFFGHDSAMFYIDTSSREIVAESTERVTRIRNDWVDIGPIVEAYGIREVDAVCHGYTSLNSQDGEVVTPLSLRSLELQTLSRAIFRPQYESDLDRPRLKKIAMLARAILQTPLKVSRFLVARAAYAAKRESAVTSEEIAGYISRALEALGTRSEAIRLFDHHTCHAAAAYYFSPFAYRQKAVVLTIDGAGDGYFSKLYLFDGQARTRLGASKSKLVRTARGTDIVSIGSIYSICTAALGDCGVTDEGNLTALAAYGAFDEEFYRELRSLLTVSAQGFDFDLSKTPPFQDVERLKLRARRIGGRNFSATVQKWLDDVVVEHLRAVHAQHGIDNLCLAGGVTANIITNLAIFERTGFRNIYVFPAMGDEGIAAGSAILHAVARAEDVSWLAGRTMPYFGHRIPRHSVLAVLRGHPTLVAEDIESSWPERAAAAIADNRIIAVVRGRMEYGPRALGNRSILANPAFAKTRDRINSAVKRRPWFQPCCPSILEDERERLFESSLPHKHMAIAFRMREQFWQWLPGAVHVDGTARAQFVAPADNPEFHRLLQCMKKLTGFGVVINTSFNLHGRPIVRTADDAITDFLDCNIDELYLEGYRITRKT